MQNPVPLVYNPLNHPGLLQTSKGLQKALKKTEVVIKNSIAFIEATSQEEMAHKISIPSLIGDPDIPVALVKHPTHTVKIKQLTRDISSHQLKEALSFCGSGITNFFLGTSSATAYVEFEVKLLYICLHKI